jgi:hypothetical protein
MERAARPDKAATEAPLEAPITPTLELPLPLPRRPRAVAVADPRYVDCSISDRMGERDLVTHLFVVVATFGTFRARPTMEEDIFDDSKMPRLPRRMSSNLRLRNL